MFSNGNSNGQVANKCSPSYRLVVWKKFNITVQIYVRIQEFRHISICDFVYFIFNSLNAKQIQKSKSHTDQQMTVLASMIPDALTTQLQINSFVHSFIF